MLKHCFMVPDRLMKFFSQAEPAEFFAQHSTEKVVAVSFTSKVLLEIHDPRDLLSGKKLWIPSVISSVQLKKKADQFWFLAHDGIFQGRRWDVSKHVLCDMSVLVGIEGGIDGIGFYLSLLEWGFRAVASLIFGDGHDGVCRGWTGLTISYTGLTLSPTTALAGHLHRLNNGISRVSQLTPPPPIYSHWFHCYHKHPNHWAAPNKPLLKQ